MVAALNGDRSKLDSRSYTCGKLFNVQHKGSLATHLRKLLYSYKKHTLFHPVFHSALSFVQAPRNSHTFIYCSTGPA